MMEILRSYKNMSHYILGFFLLVSIIFNIHLDEKVEVYQQTFSEVKPVDPNEGDMVIKYRQALLDVLAEVEEDEAEILRLERQKSALVKQVKFFDHTLTSVNMMSLDANIEPENPEIQVMASQMTEEELYGFVKDEIAYLIREDSNLKASEVLAAGEGNCLEKAALFVSLLRAKGYSPNSVYIVFGTSNFNGNDGEPPRTHAWVEMEYAGEWRVLDTTTYLGDFSFNRWTVEEFYDNYNIDNYLVYNDKMSPHVIPKIN
jgi:hypothetical protein